MTARDPSAGGETVPPLLSYGFRPFFLAAALWLPASLLLWIWTLAVADPPDFALDPLAWHRHETLFGGVGAILAGFLLTAVPSWTGVPPLRGRPLLLLLLAWLAARPLALWGGTVPAALAALAELAFLGGVLVWVARAVIRAGNRRNLPVVVLVGLFVTGAALSWAEPVLGAPTGALGDRLGLAVILLLLALIGGRIVPAFTRNWMARLGLQTLPAPFGPLDAATLAVWALTLAAWVAAPLAPPVGVLFLVAGFLHAARLVRWQGHRTLAEPLVTVLHLAYAWLPLGAVLHGLALAGLGPDPATTLHAFTTGAIGTMTLAVMTRASLGHTGRPLTADAATVVIYTLVVAGALLRLLAPLAADRTLLLALAAAAWGGAYLLFALRYGPLLVAPRADRPPLSGARGRA